MVQLRAADVPEVPFPPGTTLCQVFWCKSRHGDRYAPRPAIIWRASAGEPTDAEAALAAEGSTPAWRLVYCRVWPERVVDYPGGGDVAEATGGRFADVEDAHPEVADYAASLGAVGGWKVGGHPRWVQDPAWPMCRRCGPRMGLFLQADSWEPVGNRWQPAEEAGERPTVASPLWDRRTPTVPDHSDGTVFLFACLGCDPRHLVAVRQR